MTTDTGPKSRAHQNKNVPWDKNVSGIIEAPHFSENCLMICLVVVE